MRYLLDTNIISEFYKKAPDPNVTQWFEGLETRSLYLSCLTIGELRAGALKKAKTDSVAGKSLFKWIEKLMIDYSEQVLEIDLETCEIWAELITIDSTNATDALIAAQARQKNMVLVTRNVKHFNSYELKVVNPFIGSS